MSKCHIFHNVFESLLFSKAFEGVEWREFLTCEHDCVVTYISEVIWDLFIELIFDDFLQRYYGDLKHSLVMGVLHVAALGQVALHVLYKPGAHVLQVTLKVFDDVLK